MRRRTLIAAAPIVVVALIASGCGSQSSVIRSGSGSQSSAPAFATSASSAPAVATSPSSARAVGGDPYQQNQPLDDSTALAHARYLGEKYSSQADSAPGSVHHITVAQMAALDSRIPPLDQTGYTGAEAVVCGVVHAEWDVPGEQTLPPGMVPGDRTLPPGITTPMTPPPYRLTRYMWCRTQAAPTVPDDWRAIPSYGLVLPGNEVPDGW